MGSLAFCLFQSICLLEELFWFSHQLPKKISNNSLPTILWSGFKSVFLLSIEWTQTYVYYYFPPVSLKPKIIKSKNKIYYITSQKKKEPNIAYIHIQNCLF